MYKAIRALQNMKPKRKLVIDNENGVTTNEKEQVKIITNFFKDFFNDSSIPEKLNAPATQMRNPFQIEEIQVCYWEA